MWNTTVNDLKCIFARNTWWRTFNAWGTGRFDWDTMEFGPRAWKEGRIRIVYVYSSVLLIFAFHCFVTTNVCPSKDSLPRKHPRVLLILFRKGNLKNWKNWIAWTFNKGTSFQPFYWHGAFEILKCVRCLFWNQTIQLRNIHIALRIFPVSCPKTNLRDTVLMSYTKAFNWYEIQPRRLSWKEPLGRPLSSVNSALSAFSRFLKLKLRTVKRWFQPACLDISRVSQLIFRYNSN